MYCSSYSAPRSQATAVSSSAAANSADRIGLRGPRPRSPNVSVRCGLSQPDANDWLPPAGRRARAVAAGRRGRAAAPALRRGVNITHWFRFPPSRDPAALRGYLDDAALAELKRAGFTFVRLPVQPELLAAPGAADRGGGRLERHGLAVVVALFAADWHLETDPADRAKLLATWRNAGAAAAAVRSGDDVSRGAERAGVRRRPRRLGRAAAPGAGGDPRHACRRTPIVLTGADWGSIAASWRCRRSPTAT